VLPDAIRLWRRLHGARQDLLCVQSFFCKAGDNGKAELSNQAEAYFPPGQLEDAAAWLAQQDHNGRDCYFAVAQVFEPRRLAEHAAPTRVVHADMDGVPLETCPIPPTIVVESSPGHFHAYWVLDRYLQPAEAVDLNRRLARATGADPAAIDAVRLFRVPGTHNRKRPGVWADVKLLSVNDDDVRLAELNAALPKEPVYTPPVSPGTALSDDDNELIALLGQQSPVFGRLYAGDIPMGKYRHPDGTVDGSAVDSGLIRDLLRATDGDADRTERLMRASTWGATRNGKWDARQRNVLRYSIDRLVKRPSPPPSPRIQSGAVSTEPGCCPGGDACPNVQRANQLFQQVQLVNQVLQLNLAPIAKVTILWLMVLVGLAQSRGESQIKTSAKQIGKALWVSSQTIRPILHGLTRNDFTQREPSDVLRDERGLFDLDSDRVPEGGPFCRVFSITPLTSGGYTGFLQAAVSVAPELLEPPSKRTRAREEEVPLPPEIVQIPTCPSHLMDSTEEQTDVVCAECGEDFVQIVRTETRYVPRQNANSYRFDQHAPQHTRVGQMSANSYRFEPASTDIERLLRIYERTSS